MKKRVKDTKMNSLRDQIDNLQLSCETIREYIQEIQEIRSSTYRGQLDFMKKIPQIKTDMKSHNKDTRVLGRLYESINIPVDNSEIAVNTINTILEANKLSKTISSSLKEVKQYFYENKITITQVSDSHAAQFKYIKFTGIVDKKVEMGPHLYEFLEKLQSNFKILQTEEEVRASILKENLAGIAGTLISDSMENESEIIDILEENFGDITHILNQIRNLHFKIGIVPDAKNNQGGLQLQKRAEVALEHFNLMRRAEVILAFKKCDELYSSHHQHTIVQLLPIDDQLKRARMTCKGVDSFNDLKSKFEDIFSSASVISNNSNALLDSYPQSRVDNEDISKAITKNYAMIMDSENKHIDSSNHHKLTLKIRQQQKVIAAYKKLTKKQDELLQQLKRRCELGNATLVKKVSRYSISYSKRQTNKETLNKNTTYLSNVDDTMKIQTNKKNKEE